MLYILDLTRTNLDYIFGYTYTGHIYLDFTSLKELRLDFK